MDITYLKGIGPKKAELYRKLGVKTTEELVELYPRDYVDFTDLKTISEVQPGESCAFRAVVARKSAPFSTHANLAIYKAVLSDETGSITAVFFNAKYTFDKLQLYKEYIFFGKITGDLLNLQISSPAYVEPSEAGLLPKYPLTAGLSNAMVSANMRTALSQTNKSETLPQSILDEYGLIGADEALKKIHFPRSREEYTAARRRLVFEELLTLKLGLTMLKRRGRNLSGAVMRQADMSEFYAALPFSPTGAQRRAVEDCCRDMTGKSPMNRLVQGDVGSGKTLVAAGAAFFARQNGFQTLVMAPTEVLAKQHYKTFSELLSPLGVKVSLLTGSLTPAEKRAVRAAAASGETDVLIGTQALIVKQSCMAKTGLVVVDEQHRFGVGQRSALAEKGANPHILAMSATPIPRTLALIMYGDLDVSVLDEMPKGRLPIKTYAVDTSFRPRIYNFIKKHIAAGRQAYIICPLVEAGEEAKSEKASAVEYYNSLACGEFRDIPTGLLYGKMKQADKDRVMTEFKENRIHLLVSTTVIEVGIDVPNAVVILIENAEQFGLSQLHQLRGRVGRGSEQSYCILMTDSKSEYTAARTKAMVETTDGYKIADTDLMLRGPGNFFGREQHGLPPMKVADLADDAEVLREVERLSERIISDDPTLSREENAGLKANVERLFGQAEEYGFN